MFDLSSEVSYTSSQWIGRTFDIHGSQRMNPNNAGDPLTFSLVHYQVEFVVQSEITQNLGWGIMYFGAEILVLVHFVIRFRVRILICLILWVDYLAVWFSSQ